MIATHGSRRLGLLDERRGPYVDRPDRICAQTSVSQILTRGSIRLLPNSSAIGAQAHATTSGTNSATVIRASGPSSASAARSVKPMPSPPISMCGIRRSRILRQETVASAPSDPPRRLFINSMLPDLIENSAPRLTRRSSPPPGISAVASRDHGITDDPRMSGNGPRVHPSPKTAPDKIRACPAFILGTADFDRRDKAYWQTGHLSSFLSPRRRPPLSRRFPARPRARAPNW
jgi:hypothetical protein